MKNFSLLIFIITLLLFSFICILFLLGNNISKNKLYKNTIRFKKKFKL